MTPNEKPLRQVLSEQYKTAISLVKADGCSSAPDLWWHECCCIHDVHYRTGKDYEGKPISRSEADKKFRQCLKSDSKTFIGKHILCNVYWLAVRIFGKRHYATGIKSSERDNNGNESNSFSLLHTDRTSHNETRNNNGDEK